MRLRCYALRISFLVLLAVSLLAILPNLQGESRPVRVLFIGNSYTYFNNLPEIFVHLAEAAQRGKVETRMVAPGGWRLKDHWEKGEALKALHEGHWDFVVLQDQSTLGINYYFEGKPRVTSDEIFKPFAEKWAADIRQAGATPVFYLTWARKATPKDQAALNHAYMSAARESKAVVAPVGIAWGEVRKSQPGIELFFKDGSHPAPAGSYLAACTLFAVVFNQSPEGLPAKVEGPPVNLDSAKTEPDKTAVLVDLPPDQAKILQSAAWAARQLLADKGGYLDDSPVSQPAAALPAGRPLTPAGLKGVWTGDILFYPVGPVGMELRLHWDGAKWSGHLELKYRSKDLKDESFDLADLKVDRDVLIFSDPKSPGASNLKVSFRGVNPSAGELRGIAEATLDSPESPARLLGTWRLHRKLP